MAVVLEFKLVPAMDELDEGVELHLEPGPLVLVDGDQTGQGFVRLAHGLEVTLVAGDEQLQREADEVRQRACADASTRLCPTSQ